MFGFSKLGGSATDTPAQPTDKLLFFRNAVDKMDTMVMICEAGGEQRILYMNEKAITTMRHHHGHLRERLRGADPLQAFGGSIHRYHPDSSRIRAILASLQTPDASHSADIDMGSIVFRTHTYPVFDSEQAGLVEAFVTCWEDVTVEIRERKLEKKLAAATQLQDQIGQIAIAIDQLRSSVEGLAQHADRGRVAAENMSSSAESGQRSIHDLVKAMSDVANAIRTSRRSLDLLRQSSSEIDSIVRIIGEIAQQTNLLALNAAIEASRAGEAGRGFSVVAAEVRRLSERTTQATAQISTAISSIQGEVQETVASMQQADGEAASGERCATDSNSVLLSLLDDIATVRNLVTGVSSAVTDQLQATTDISHRLQLITESAADMGLTQGRL